MADYKFGSMWRAFGVAGLMGGGALVLVFLGVLEGEERGDTWILILGLVLLAFGFYSFRRWIKTF